MAVEIPDEGFQRHNGEQPATRALDPGEPAVALVANAFIGAFRQHPAGVTVVTLDGSRGPVGFTATSVTSISLEPPLLSFAISTASSCWPELHAASTCVVNMLAADQHQTARRFAARGVNRFDPPTQWERLSSGDPVLTGVAAWLHCRIAEKVVAGDHRVVIAHVLDGRLQRRGVPLVYHDGDYSTVGDRFGASDVPSP